MPSSTALAPRRSASRRRPPLRVVSDAARSRRTRARRLTTAGIAVFAIAVFGLVAAHVALAQGQFQLEHIEAEAERQQSRYEELRLRVAEMESPARVVAAATDLGLVHPENVTYLAPDVGDRPEVEAPADSMAWTTVKPYLAENR